MSVDVAVGVGQRGGETDLNSVSGDAPGHVMDQGRGGVPRPRLEEDKPPAASW